MPRPDRVADLLECGEVTLDKVVREKPLVDDANCAVVRRPLHGLNDHGTNLLNAEGRVQNAEQ